MRKNIANQTEDFQSVSITTGGPVLGTPEVYITQGTGPAILGLGSFVHKGRGQWQYVFTQAETNADKLAVQFVLAGAVTQLINLYPVAYDPANTLNLGLSELAATHTAAITDIPLILATKMNTSHLNATLGVLDEVATVSNGAKLAIQNLASSDIALMSDAIQDVLVDTHELQSNQDNWLTATGFSTFNPTLDTVILAADQTGVTIGNVNQVSNVVNGAKSATALSSSVWTSALAVLIPTINAATTRIPIDPATETSLADKMPIGHLSATNGILDEVTTVSDGAKLVALATVNGAVASIQSTVTDAQFGLAAVQLLINLNLQKLNIITGTDGTIVDTTSITDIAAAVGGGGSSLWTQPEIDAVIAQVASLNSRVPAANIWAYITAHAEASQPVTFLSGTEITAIISTIDTQTAPVESGCINGRLLYFNDPTSILYRQMVRIHAYDGGSKTVSFTSLTSAVLATDTAILI